MTIKYKQIYLSRLFAGIILAAIAALSTHVWLLQILNIPFPDLSILTRAARWTIRLAQVAGLIIFWRLAYRDGKGSFLKQWSSLFLIVSMLNESLLRGPFMGGYCTGAFIYAFVSNLSALLTLAILSALVIFSIERLSRGWHTIIAALAIATIMTFAAPPLIGSLMHPVMSLLSSFSPKREWCVLPYGSDVLVPAYITYLEPALACLGIAILVWNRLDARLGIKLTQFIIIILAMKTQLLMPFLYAALSKDSFFNALISEGQFAAEAAVLALSVGITWQLSHPPTSVYGVDS